MIRKSMTFALMLIALSRISIAADSPTVGMPSKIESLVLPGTELEVKPLDDRKAPIVLRITASYVHGDSFRYDLTYYGLEPGDFDLSAYLQRKDGATAAAGLPKIPVTIRPIRPPGQIEPNKLKPSPTPSLGGYRFWLALGASVWVAGLVAILGYGRGKKGQGAANGPHRLTLADRLRPLVEGAMDGTLNEGQHAELERLLMGYWRHRLNLDDTNPAEAIALMKQDEKAGPLLKQLEVWLHQPDGKKTPVDIVALLEPYRDLPAETAVAELPGHTA
jgi:hypothetical protein